MRLKRERCCVIVRPVTRQLIISGAYLEGPLRLVRPFLLTVIFYDGIFCRFTNFFFQNIKI